MNYVLRKLVPSWIARGFGYSRDGLRVLVLIWADDFTFVAAGIEQLQKMLCEFQHFMMLHGVSLKKSKSYWMANARAFRDLGREEFEMKIPDITFQRQESLVVLGARLAANGDSQVSLRYSIQRAWRHWFQRRV